MHMANNRSFLTANKLLEVINIFTRSACLHLQFLFRKHQNYGKFNVNVFFSRNTLLQFVFLQHQSDIFTSTEYQSVYFIRQLIGMYSSVKTKRTEIDSDFKVYILVETLSNQIARYNNNDVRPKSQRRFGCSFYTV